MIFVSLNWWESLNDVTPLENNAANVHPLAILFSSWRMIASVVAGVGVAIQVPFLNCAALDTTQLSNDKYCSAWLEPPQVVASLLGLDDAPGLETLATIAVTIYATYLVYYVLVILPEIGRDGRASRSFFTFIDPLIALGILKQ